MFLPHHLVKLSIVGSLRDREVACSASDLQGLNFESCVWRAVSSLLSRHPQEVVCNARSLQIKREKVIGLLFYKTLSSTSDQLLSDNKKTLDTLTQVCYNAGPPSSTLA